MIERSARDAMEIAAELATPTARVQLVHYHFPEPPDNVLPAIDSFRVELCLTSRHRSSRARFRDRWGPNRFEPIGDLFLAPPHHELAASLDIRNPALHALLLRVAEETRNPGFASEMLRH